MPVVVSVMTTPAPMHLVDHMTGMGRMADGAASCRHGRARRRAGKTEGRSRQRNDEDCTHFKSPGSSGRRRAGASNVQRSIVANSPASRRRSPLRDGTPRIPNGAWLTRSLLVHWPASH